MKKQKQHQTLPEHRILGTVHAVDQKGAKYQHDVIVFVRKYDGRACLNFGRGPMSYFLSDLEKHHPYSEHFCIDAAGRNHGCDSAVIVKSDDINKFIRSALDKVRELSWKM